MPAVVIVFNVIAGDLQIADFTAFDANTTKATVADVAGADDGLMQVDAIQIDTNAGIVIDVAVTDEYVAGRGSSDEYRGEVV
jgi:MinD-like ATPase involved in chromosome partitioning or flagellar assembly